MCVQLATKTLAIVHSRPGAILSPEVPFLSAALPRRRSPWRDSVALVLPVLRLSRTCLLQRWMPAADTAAAAVRGEPGGMRGIWKSGGITGTVSGTAVNGNAPELRQITLPAAGGACGSMVPEPLAEARKILASGEKRAGSAGKPAHGADGCFLGIRLHHLRAAGWDCRFITAFTPAGVNRHDRTGDHRQNPAVIFRR